LIFRTKILGKVKKKKKRKGKERKGKETDIGSTGKDSRLHGVTLFAPAECSHANRLVAFTAEWQSSYGENYKNPKKVSEWMGRLIGGRVGTDDASSRHPAVII